MYYAIAMAIGAVGGAALVLLAVKWIVPAIHESEADREKK